MFLSNLIKKQPKIMKNIEFDIKKRTFQFAVETLLLCKQIQETDREFILTKQLIRSATSVGANI